MYAPKTPLSGCSSCSGLGATPAIKASWLRAKYARADARTQKAYRNAGLNVPSFCPDGSKIIPAGSKKYNHTDRWICRDQPGCDQPYMVWHPNKNRWQCEVLECKTEPGIECGTGKKFYEKAARSTGRALVKVGKVTVDLATLPFQQLLKISLAAGKVLCGLPQPIQIAAATAAGIPTPTAIAVVPVFCNVVKGGKIKTLNDLKDVKKVLPIVLAIVAKVGVARQQIASQAQQDATRAEIEEQAKDSGVDAITNLIDQQVPGAGAAARFTADVASRGKDAAKAATDFAQRLAPKLTPSRVAAMKRAIKLLKAQGRGAAAAKIEAKLRVSGQLSEAAIHGVLRGYTDPMIIALANTEKALSGLNESEIQLLAGISGADPEGVKEVVDEIPDEEVRKAFFLSRKVAYGVGGGAALIAGGLGLYFAFRD